MTLEGILFDRDGNPISDQEWIEKMRDIKYKRVAYDEIDSITVSTVWTGIDFHAGGFVFETMVFDDDAPLENNRWLWKSEVEALAGHQEIVEDILS